MDNQPKNEDPTSAGESTDMSNPASPAIDLITPPGSVEAVPEKSVEQGILDTRIEMAGLPISERVGFVRSRVGEHATAALLISESCRLSMKERRSNLERMGKKMQSLFNDLDTLEHFLRGTKNKATELRSELTTAVKEHDELYQKVKKRDGHLDFVTRLMDVTAVDMENTWTTLNEKLSSLEAENSKLRQQVYQLKGNYFRKRASCTATATSAIDSNDLELISYVNPLKKPKMEIDLTVEEGSEVVKEEESLSKADIKCVNFLNPLVLPELPSTPSNSNSDSVSTDATSNTDTSTVTDTKDIKPIEFKNKPKGWTDADAEMVDEVKTELSERQKALFEQLQEKQKKEEEEKQKAAELLEAKIKEVKDKAASARKELEKKKEADLEYEKQAAKALAEQKKASSMIASKKEEAARRESESHRRRDSDLLSTAPPQTLFARRTSDGFEIRYLKANLIECRERVPEYLESDWPLLTETMLQELLPQVTCIRFVFGDGLVGAGKPNTVHCDLLCPRSHVSNQIVDKKAIRSLSAPIKTTLEWGRCREFECSKYVDTVLSDPLTRRLRFPVRLNVVEDPSFDKKRLTLGFDFLSKYLHSKKGPLEDGDVLFGDGRGHWWATTYQKKTEETEVCGTDLGIGTLAHNAAEQAEEFVRKVWKNCHFHALPQWLQDNDFLHHGHRPPLNSFWACFKSIFRVHTETVNIWTHLLGCIGFIGIAVYFLTRPSNEIKAQEKLIFMLYFAGTIICLGLSSAFHTLHCHSEWVGKLFSKLDYCGIAVLIMVSFVPWLYYGFYCHLYSKIVYTAIVLMLGLVSIIFSLWEKFSQPQLRPFRAAVFTTFGLSGVVPAIHYVFVEGWFNKIALASLGWLTLMGSLYIIGALIYALRIPERFFPGKCDIWFQSHQIFHVFVIIAAFVHYHGITEMAMHRLSVGECQSDIVL